MDSLPIANQKYNDSIFKIAVYKLIDQEPGIVSWVLDSTISKLYNKSTPVCFKDLLPMNRMTLKMYTTVIYYPIQKKVNYLWMCRKVVQLLLWTERRCAKDISVFQDDYKISASEINANIIKFQQIMSDYASHLAPRPGFVGSDQQLHAESSALPSYQNAIQFTAADII